MKVFLSRWDDHRNERRHYGWVRHRRHDHTTVIELVRGWCLCVRWRRAQ